MRTPDQLALRVAEILDSKKASNITILKVDHLTSITDYFVIASGRSVQAVHALYEEVSDKLLEEGIAFRRNDGVRESRWIVLDYSSVIVHIFHQEEREHYNLERLWDDGTNRVPFEAQSDEEAGSK
ncbi:MAG: ribosome silencing factor [Clostridia bacterium]|nr:ribosome silencing factor [Clostridia bacterium]MBR5751740.1 ribosome silencing factor [Clostridia bacterium]